MQLITALRYHQPVPIAFVGAGGKTTAIFTAARELLVKPGQVDPVNTVLVTTSTHLGAWQARQADHHIIISSDSDFQNFRNHIPNGLVLVTGEESDHLLCGLNPDVLEKVGTLGASQQLPVFIEADGSRMHPVKAPAEYEPAIPEFVKAVVVVAGMQALGKPVHQDWVHRPEKFCEITGLSPGQRITGEAIRQVLLSTDAGLKNIPAGARRIALLNQADTPEQQAAAKGIGEELTSAYQSAIVSSLATGEDHGTEIYKPGEIAKGCGVHAVIEQTAGIILAAGGSSRFGQPKQLLTWRGEPLVRHVAKTALRAGLNPVIVVLGADADAIEPVIKDIGLRIVINQAWMDGVSTSIKTGLSALKEDVGGVIFLQADQPQIPVQLVSSLIEEHRNTLNPIVAPQIDGVRGNPVLFDQTVFPALSALEGDRGGRALFSHYPIDWVTWHDPKALMDIDSPGDYQDFLNAFSTEEVPG